MKNRKKVYFFFFFFLIVAYMVVGIMNGQPKALAKAAGFLAVAIALLMFSASRDGKYKESKEEEDPYMAEVDRKIAELEKKYDPNYKPEDDEELPEE